MKTKIGKCKRMIDLPGPFVDDDGQPKRQRCGAPTVIHSYREEPGGRPIVEEVCSSCDALPDEVDTKCVDCGQPTANSQEGICYECSTVRHAMGSFDMDGAGWL